MTFHVYDECNRLLSSRLVSRLVWGVSETITNMESRIRALAVPVAAAVAARRTETEAGTSVAVIKERQARV